MHGDDKPFLSLDALVRAAWRMIEADALPAPRGVDVQEMANAGCLRPWLAEALGPEGAMALQRTGKGGWWLGALMGRNFPRRRDEAWIAFDEADRGLLMLVDRMCSFARSYEWGLVRDAMEERTPETEAFLSRLEEAVLRASTRRRARGDGALREGRRTVARRVVGEVARLRGIATDPLAVTMDVVRSVEVAKVAARTPPTAREMTVHRDACTHYVFESPDGHRWGWADRFGVLDGPHGHAWEGSGVELSLAGVTPGGRGYVRGARTLDDIREEGRRKAFLSAREPLQPAIDANGVALSERDAVELLHGCLEAAEGTRGVVVEVAGEMAVVRFEGRRKPVPCYAMALARTPVTA